MTSPPGPATEGNAFDRLLARRIEVDWVLLAYVLVFAAAFALRFWDLGARALHHDESIHAKWAWDFAQGSYTHSPVFHGPLLYLVQGFTFIVFTATDYTARISPAFFGMLVVAAPLLLRRWLGSTGAFAAVTFLAFSPTLVYYSRFLRMDIFLAFFLLVLVAAMWKYLHDGRTRWLIVFAAALALAYSTKEAAFLFVAFLLLYLNGQLALDLTRERTDESGGRVTWARFFRAAALYPLAWIIAAVWPLLREAGAWRRLPRAGDLIVLTGTLTLPFLVPFAKPLLEVISSGPLDFPEICAAASTRDVAALATGFAVACAIATLAGLLWRPRTWLIAAGVAVFIYLTLVTSLWTNLDGFCTGLWGSIDHWQAQHDYRRGMQPWFYYLMVMPAYEFLPLLLALAGGAWALVKGSPFARFLVLWFLTLFAALSFAGEKMPWLNTHLAVPAALIAAWTIQRAWEHWRAPPLHSRALLTIAFALSTAALTLVVFVLDWGPPLAVRVTWGAVALLVTIVTTGFVASNLGPRTLPMLVALVVVASLAFFSIRTMIEVTFERGDVPRDMLIYTQSSPDITRMADEIDALAQATGKGADLRIAIDSRTSFAWPWVWYLRDYDNVVFSDMEAGLPQGEFDVVLVNATNAAIVSQNLVSRGVTSFAPPTRYPHRWWFPETYKNALTAGPLEGMAWRQIGSGIFKGTWAKDAFSYWRDHEPSAELGSVDGLAYFPLDFDRETGRLTTQTLEPARPGVDDAGRPMFGGRGARPGQFSAPVDIESGPDGTLYVIDRTTGILQRFDAGGSLLSTIDIRATFFNDARPWGLAVGQDGTVFVADTFGWRILAFDAELHGLTLSLGERPPLDGTPPGPYHLFGPRDIAIDATGHLWVTDTGHNRIVVYTSAGEYIREIGAPFSAEALGRGSGSAEFSEPVGIDIAPNGEIVIADMWNARVQILDPSGAYLREFPVEGWGGLDHLDKPYLRVLRDGSIALSLPSLGQVHVYSDTGALITVIDPKEEPLRSPYGIVETPGGKLWIVEGGAGRVRLFDSAEAGER